VSWKASLATFALLGAAALVLFHLFQREIAGSWLAFGVHPQVLAELESSLADQKRLARAEPERESEYRQRFGRIEALLGHLRVLSLSRGEIARRYELALSGLLVAVLAAVAGAHAWRQAREGRRLERLRLALGDLATGRTDLVVGVAGRDPVGRVAGMVEEASRTMAKDRRRIASLENLSAWQEAARRHAHEMRTPLTAARLELDQLGRLGPLLGAPEATHLVASVEQEIDRLEKFTQSFATFARLPRPSPRIEDLGALAAEFVELFGSAWPNLALSAERPAKAIVAAVDREMIRQVWVNLLENTAQACGEQGGRVLLKAGEGPTGPFVEIADDGPGIAPEILPRLFEPYVSGRPGGGGMGLGLAISRKILLDHGGDLELIESSRRGARFRLALPRPEDVG
jgi:signal transduction histidine kinase